MQIIDSIISHGSFLTNSLIEHSVVGIRSRINSNVHLKVCSIKIHDYVKIGGFAYMREKKSSLYFGQSK